MKKTVWYCVGTNPLNSLSSFVLQQKTGSNIQNAEVVQKCNLIKTFQVVLTRSETQWSKVNCSVSLLWTLFQVFPIIIIIHKTATHILSEDLESISVNDLTLGYQNSDSASSSKFHHWPLLALLVALVLTQQI